MSNYFYKKTNDYIFEADPGLPLRVKLDDPQIVTVLHQHEFCECVFVIRGHGMHQSENHDPVPVRRGCVLVIPVGGHHAYTAVSPDFAVFNLLFDTGHLPPVLLELYSHPGYKQIFLRDYAAYGEQDFPLTTLDSKVFGELETMLEYLSKTGLGPAAELLLKTEFSLKEIADQSGFARMPYFFKSFKACYGVSPLEYRNPKKRVIRNQ